MKSRSIRWLVGRSLMLSKIKSALRRALPVRAIDLYRRVRYGRTWFDTDGRTVETVFTEIYRRNLWGGDDGRLYSGPGSDPAVTGPYVEAVTRFIREHRIESVVDVGCGDFRVGEQIAALGVRYHGIDVVPDVIEHHQARHARPGVSFSCRNAIDDELPEADLGLVRQVLQHLSNEQIQRVLNHCRGFRHLVVTEHVLPADRIRTPNMDIHHGNETREEIGSCVMLDRPPFDCRIVETLCEVVLPDGTLIRTMRVAIEDARE
jgi:SAM-dependent methyltransferase